MRSFKCASEALNALTAKFYENIALFEEKCDIGIFTYLFHGIRFGFPVFLLFVDLHRIDIYEVFCDESPEFLRRHGIQSTLLVHRRRGRRHGAGHPVGRLLSLV